MVDGGRAPDGRQLVSRAWIELSTSPAMGDGQGLLWLISYEGAELRPTPARRAALRAGGFAEADKLAPLDGRAFTSVDEYLGAAKQLLTAAEVQRFTTLARTNPALRPWEMTHGRRIGFHHDGSLGQYLEVDPTLGMIVVRLNEPETDPTTMEAYAAEEEAHGMHDFYTLVRALVPAKQ